MAEPVSSPTLYPGEPAPWRRYLLAGGLALLAHVAAVALLAVFLAVAPAREPVASENMVVQWQFDEPSDLPEEVPEPEPPPPPEYVEANPDANTDAPDPTRQESFQDQQAAQEEPDTVSDDAIPAVDGERDNSRKIVSDSDSAPTHAGAPAPPVSTAPPTPAGTPQQARAAEAKNVAENEAPPSDVSTPGEDRDAAAPESSDRANPETAEEGSPDALQVAEGPPVPDEASERSQPQPEAVLEGEPEGEDGPASAEQRNEVPQELADSRQGPERDPGFVEEPEDRPPQASGAAAASPNRTQPRSQPAPRPQVPQDLKPKVTQGPLARTTSRAGRQGALAIDSRLSEFGVYQGRMLEAIEQQWLINIRRTGARFSESSSAVTIVFTVAPDGTISGHETVASTAERIGELASLEAILSRAPFGEWTEEMQRVLGDDVEVRITFIYGYLPR